MININGYFLKIALFTYVSSEGTRVEIVGFRLPEKASVATALSKKISTETGIDVEVLGRSVLSVSVTMVLTGLPGWSSEDVLVVKVEVHGCSVLNTFNINYLFLLFYSPLYQKLLCLTLFSKQTKIFV